MVPGESSGFCISALKRSVGDLQILEFEDFGESILHGSTGIRSRQVEEFVKPGIIGIAILTLVAVLLEGHQAGDEVGEVLGAFTVHITGDFSDCGKFSWIVAMRGR